MADKGAQKVHQTGPEQFPLQISNSAFNKERGERQLRLQGSLAEESHIQSFLLRVQRAGIPVYSPV